MRRIRATLISCMAAASLALTSAPAAALSLIRDAEIEATLDRMTAPVMKAAGMRPGTVAIHIVNSRALNAFVAGGRNMFLNTGLIGQLDTPEELTAVIAHELGHIAGGHEIRRNIGLRNAQGPALIALLVGIAAGAAGGGGAAAAVTGGAQDALARAFLAYNRGEEAAADQAALSYLSRAGIDPSGMLSVLERFRGQEVFNVGNVDPYVLTHPLSTQRVELVQRRVAEMEAGGKVDDETAYWHRRMQAKLEGFLDSPSRVVRRYEGTSDETELYAIAVAYHRLPAPREAIATMDRLIALRPQDAYYLELKGQILHESGRAAEAVPYYRRAVALAPDQPLLKAGLGRTLLALDDPQADAEALAVLKSARTHDRGDPAALRDLATAYSRAGDIGMATLATAERFALAGRTTDAVLHAKRADKLLPRGSPGWLRAQDILVLDTADD